MKKRLRFIIYDKFRQSYMTHIINMTLISCMTSALFLKERTSAMLQITPVLNEEDEASGPLGSCARSVAMLPLQPASSRTATPTQHRLEHRFQCIQYNKYLKKTPFVPCFQHDNHPSCMFFLAQSASIPHAADKRRERTQTHTHF